MKTTLLTVGKTDKAWVREGMDIYSSRLKHYTRLEICEIPELKNVSALSREEIKSREGALILKNIRNEDRVVLLAVTVYALTTFWLAILLSRRYAFDEYERLRPMKKGEAPVAPTSPVAPERVERMDREE